MTADATAPANLNRRVQVTGASGAGTTTLGRVLAQALALPHHDTDDYLWVPTGPPYQRHRPVAERLALMETMFLPRGGWVLSGSVSEWAANVTARLDLVVFITTPAAVRAERLLVREARARGRSREATAADPAFREFRDWALGYDDGGVPGRILAGHERWLASLRIPVLRVDGGRPLPDLLDRCLEGIGAAPLGG